MMYIKNFAAKTLLLLGVTTALASCVRDNDFFPNGDSESARVQTVRILEAEDLIQRARPVDPAIDTFVLFEVRRSPNNESELKQPLTVTLNRGAAILNAYNTAHGTSFEELPTAQYTLLDNAQSITFQPGEFAKQVRIRFDKNNIDLSKQYALGFAITSPGTGAAASVTQDTAVISVGVINKYDGIYEVSGSLNDVAVATITGAYPYEVEFQTSGPNSVIVINDGDDRHLIKSSGALSVYGSFGVEFTFDPLTDKVIKVENIYGQPASNSRSAEIDPAGANQYNASSKTLDVKYIMKQPTVVTTPPNIRTYFDEHFEYKGPR